MADGNLTAGAVYQNVASDADEIRKVSDNIESNMKDYVDDMKKVMLSKVQTKFALDFERDLDLIYVEKVGQIHKILNANAQNINYKHLIIQHIKKLNNTLHYAMYSK